MKNNRYFKELLPLFSKFINESKSGKRIQKNGKKISKASIENYLCTFKYLVSLNSKSTYPIVINTKYKKTKQESVQEKKYWNNFFIQYKKEMIQNACSDNYINLCLKNLKTFFKYLENDKNFPKASFYQSFNTPQFETPVFVLDQDKLKFLITNKDFEDSLPNNLKVAKDIFVIGCTIGLRFSDLINLKKNNLHIIEGSTYIVTTSKKTNTHTRIKVPEYIVNILNKHNKKSTISLLPKMKLITFNKYIKKIGELAGWTDTVGKERVYNGQKKDLKTKKGVSYRYCDMLSSHTMRKTAITTLLIMGMPEPLVRKISGHAPNSKEFHKYVKYSESFLDSETDKAFSKLLEGN